MTLQDLLSIYLKRFGALATAWREKYEADIFLQATVSVVLLLAALVVVCVVLFGFVINYTDQQVIHAIVDNIRAIVSGSGTEVSLSSSVQSIQTTSVWYVFLGLVAVAALFGYLFTRFMLRPTRNTLHYQKVFISNVAHELRTPLSVIKTSTEVALLGDELPVPLRGLLDEIVGELDRVSEIINNLLSLNSLIRPERMQLSNVALGPLVDTVVARHRLLAAERGVGIVVKKDMYDVVWGNTTGLEQVVTNILKNAINYTRKDSGGVVTVSVQPDYRGSVIFTVSDNGIGISHKDLVHIFEPFYRADTSRVRDIRKTGSGLGLAIVSEIVRTHHGKITIESGRSKGTTVSVSLPIGTTHQTLGQAAEPAERNEMSIDYSHGHHEPLAVARARRVKE